MAPDDDVEPGERNRVEKGQEIAEEIDRAQGAAGDHQDPGQHHGNRRPGDRRHPFAQNPPGHHRGDQRRGGEEDQHIGGAGVFQGDDEHDKAQALQQSGPQSP